MNKNATILIVGHNDIIEKSLYRYFQQDGYKRAFTTSEIGMNTAIQNSVYKFFQEYRPEYVFLGSTRSGGIEANIKNGAEFIYHNLESQNNIVYAAHKFGVKKLLYFASSCVYPRDCPQPIKEEYCLTGALEPTSEPYATAKIAGIRLCQAYRRQYGFNAIVAVPATIYGPVKDDDWEKAHVITALMGKFCTAVKKGDKDVTVWGSGNPRREFLYMDDFIDASLFLMNKYDGEEIINIGCGEDVTIKELAKMIAGISGFEGNLVFDSSKPDGAMQKLLDSSKLAKLGWASRISLNAGLEKTWRFYDEMQHELKHRKNDI